MVRIFSGMLFQVRVARCKVDFSYLLVLWATLFISPLALDLVSNRWLLFDCLPYSSTRLCVPISFLSLWTRTPVWTFRLCSSGAILWQDNTGWHLKVSDFNETLGLESPWFSFSKSPKKFCPPPFFPPQGAIEFCSFCEIRKNKLFSKNHHCHIFYRTKNNKCVLESIKWGD